MELDEVLDALNRVASLVNKACRLPCMKRICPRLYQTLSELPPPENDSASLYTAMLTGVLEAAYQDALENNCVRGASLLLAALRILREVSEAGQEP